MIQPPKISSNDKAIIISPAGNIESELVYKAVSILTSWGLSVDISENALSQVGRFSGTVKQRLSDLQMALDDSEIKLILCSRGGYGVVHLLDKLDLTRFKQNPKWIVGFSDITGLHSVLQNSGCMSIHGPMAKHFAEEGIDDISVNYIKDIIEGRDLDYQFDVEDTSNLNKNGEAKGVLFGGNLAVFCGLLGTDLIYTPKDGILFIEDIGESPYKVDRLINQLKLSGIFKQISGLIIGQFTNYEEDADMYNPLYESIAEALSDYNFPICFNFPVGHVKNNLPLIVGKEANLIVEDNHTIFKQTL